MSENDSKQKAPKKAASESKTSINWSITEAPKRDFSPKWYAGVVFGFLALIALAIFVIKSWSFVVLLVISALALVVFIRRPSRTIHYSLSTDGVSIDGVNHAFDKFKSFGVMSKSDQTHRLVLIPTKRFSPALEVDFESKEGEAIVDFVGARLPMQKVEANFVDNIIDRLGL